MASPIEPMIYKISMFQYQGLDFILIHGLENYFLPTLIPQQEILFGGAYKRQFKETSCVRKSNTTACNVTLRRGRRP